MSELEPLYHQLRRNARKAAAIVLRVAVPLLLGGVLTLHAAGPREVPAFPTHYVLDEPHLLSDSTRKSLEALLIEHDLSTGEQLVIGIFKSPPEPFPDWTQRIFRNWKPGAQHNYQGALLALDPKEREARFEIGYGLDAKLPEKRARKIISDYLEPELEAGTPDRAIALAVYQTLQTLESPVVQSGQAERLIRAGGIRGSLEEARTPGWGNKSLWVFWPLLGIAFMTGVLYVVTAAEKHFTREGWFRPNPWSLLLETLEGRFNHLRSKNANPPLGKAWGGSCGEW